MTIRAALYCRGSTEEQSQRYGLGAQLERLRERVRERGYTVAGEFIDDGWSGGSLERPALTRLRDAVGQGMVELVLVYDPDRLARDLADLLLLDKEFQKGGVRLETITTEIDGSPEGRMFFQFKGAFAEYERAIIRRRTMEGRRRKAKEGKLVNPRNLPRWLAYDREKGAVILDEEWAEVVRLAYHLVAEERLTLGGVVRRFHELSTPSPTGGAHWRASTLREWLRSTTAKGEYYQFRTEQIEARRHVKPVPMHRKTSSRERPREEWQMVQVPPVVPPEIWERVQRRLDQNRALASRNTRHEYLLQGLVRCGQCGRRMTGRYVNGSGRRFYRCTRSSERGVDVHGEACSQRVVPADHLEETTWDAVAALMRDPEALREELARRRLEGSPTREAAEWELQIARKRLQAIPKEQERLVGGYTKGLIPDESMRMQMEALKSERVALSEKVAELERGLARLELTEEQESQALDFAEQVRDGLERLDFSGRQQFMRLVLEDVTCYDGRAVVHTIIPPRPSVDAVHLQPRLREGERGDEVSRPATGMLLRQ